MDRNISLIMREDLRTVKVGFGVQSVADARPADMKLYQYATNLRVLAGDLVLVKSGGRLLVATVLEVHDALEISPNSDIEYDLVVQKLDLTPYLEEKRKLKELEEVLHEEYRRRARLSARESLLMTLDDAGRAKVQALLGGAK